MKTKNNYRIDDILVIDTYWGGGRGRNFDKEFDSFSAIDYKDLTKKIHEMIFDVFKRKIGEKDDVVTDVRTLYFEKYTPLRYFLKDQKKRKIKHSELVQFLFLLTDSEKNKFEGELNENQKEVQNRQFSDC